MKKVGITGGIGAGKTLVCQLFEVMGIPYYSADDRAKWLQNNDHTLRKQLIELLGKEAYETEDKSLNRPFVAQKVFSDKALLNQLNQLVHPAVAHDFKKWCMQYESYPFILKEAALLFETKSYLSLDATILVQAKMDTRIERILARDPQRSKEEVQNIIDKQMSEDEKLLLADQVIINDEQHSLIKQVEKMIAHYSI